MPTSVERDLEKMKLFAQAVQADLVENSQHRRELVDRLGVDNMQAVLYHAQDVQLEGIGDLISTLDGLICFEQHTMAWIQEQAKVKYTSSQNPV